MVTSSEPSKPRSKVRDAVMRTAVRGRYAVLALCAALLTQRLIVAAGPHRFNDWILFEAAARSIVRYHHLSVYEGNPLGVYARLPLIQIGPPAILPVAALQWLAPWTVSKIFVVVIVVLGLGGVAAAELAARAGTRSTPADTVGPAALVGGLIVVGDWSWCAVDWHHLDDAIALSFTAIACWLIVRARPWWLVGTLIGTAIAAKPWALILAPVFLGLPREVRSKAILAAVVVAAAWWGPFVIGGPGTISALGGYHIGVQDGSVLALVGIHGDVERWLRPVQFGLGLSAGVLMARVGGRAWLASPLAALAVRVLTDPFSWGYYGMGPILFALVWDLARPSARRVPMYTLVTAVIEGIVPWTIVFNTFGPASGKAILVASLKLAWGVGILVALYLELRRSRSRADEMLRGDSPGELNLVTA